MPYRLHKTRQYELSLAKGLSGGIFTLIFILMAWLWLAEKPDRVRKPLPEMTLAPASVALAPTSGAATSVTDQPRPFRLVYRNSVIPGGVRSAAELAAAVQRDAVINAHYADFNVASAKLIEVKQSRLVHVSYRIGDQIYWTKNKVHLAPGEELLSDGTHLVRARCGNRIADEPEGPVLDNEPAPAVLDTVFVSANDLIDQSANMVAVKAVGASSPAVAATTSTTTQAAAPGSALKLSSEALFPAPDAQDRWGQRTPAQLVSTSVLPADTVSLGSALLKRFDPDDPPPPVPAPPVTPPLPGPTPAVTPTSIPEPGSTSLFGLALVGLALIRRRPGRSKCADGH